MDYLELHRTLDDLNEWKSQAEDGRIEPELDRLNDYLKPYGLCVMLIASPYSQRYPVVFAVMSRTAEEQ